jgi:prepilin-type N-terminal cleavage/methylation domain-containing protein
MMKKIINLKQNKKGFTLIELLASIAVIVVIGSVIAGIITSSLRGSNKTNTIEAIRQNGNYALSQISKNIEYAQVFNGLSRNGTNYDTSCQFSIAPTPTPVITPYNFIKITGLNNNIIEYKCDTSASPVVFTVNNNGNENAIIDTNSVNLTSCSITCTQTNETDVPIIGIGFTLGPKKQNGLVENSTPPITFQTSVTMRNYAK